MSGIHLPRAFRRLVSAGVICLVFMLLVTTARAAEFVGQVVKALGAISITRDGGLMQASASTALQLGDVIKTGPGARLRLRFVDGSILTVGENTSFSIDIFSVDATNKSRTVLLTLLTGILNTAAAKSGESTFDYRVQTATGYSAVRGTKWIVALQQQVTAVFVLSGLVEVGSAAAKAKPVLVDSGKSVSIGANGALGPVQPTPPSVLQQILAATSDTGGGGAAPTTTPVEAEPAVPVAPKFPVFPRAIRNDKNHDFGGGRDSTHDK